jgi:adenylyltransferase/sulfurtransferase
MPFLQFDKHLPAALQLCGIQPEQTLQPAQQEQQSQAAAAAAAASNGANVDAAVSAGSVAKPVVVMCRRGNHSQLAVQRLREAGVAHAVDVVGGYEAWAQTVDTAMPLL